jgi:predicted RNA binding protein YcfA (HicA-like mRNA interferase family)
MYCVVDVFIKDFFMFQFRTLAAITALFLSTSASLMGMIEEKEENASSLSLQLNQKNEQLKNQIFDIISQKSHAISPKKLQEVTKKYFLVQEKYLAQQSGYVQKKRNDLLKEWEKSTQENSNFLLKRYASFYAKNPFTLNSFFEELKKPTFFEKSLEAFPVESVCFDFVKNLYTQGKDAVSIVKDEESFLKFIIPYAFAEEKNQKITLSNLPRLFAEDSKKQPYSLLYFLSTHFVASFSDKQSEICPIIGGNDDYHFPVNASHIQKAWEFVQRSPTLNSLPFRALVSRRFSALSPQTIVRNVNIKALAKNTFSFESNVTPEHNFLLAQDLIKELCGESIHSFEKRKLFMPVLQNAIMLIGNFGDISLSNQYDNIVKLLSSVSYNPDKIPYLENAPNQLKQEFRKLEILRNISIFTRSKNKVQKNLEQTLTALNEFIFHCEAFKKNALHEDIRSVLSELLQVSGPGQLLLNKKNQLVEKHRLLTKLGLDEEADKVFQELLEKQAFWKAHLEEKKKTQLEKKSNTGKIVQQLLELDKREKEKNARLEEERKKKLEEIKRKKKELRKERKEERKIENSSSNIDPMKEDIEEKGENLKDNIQDKNIPNKNEMKINKNKDMKGLPKNSKVLSGSGKTSQQNNNNKIQNNTKTKVNNKKTPTLTQDLKVSLKKTNNNETKINKNKGMQETPKTPKIQSNISNSNEVKINNNNSIENSPTAPNVPSNKPSKTAEFSDNAEKLSKNAKNTLRLLFSRYTGALTWKQISQQIFFHDIKLLLNSAGFDLVPGNGSHFNVKKRGEEKNLTTIPFHDKKTSAIYLKLLTFLFVERGIYPLALEKKLLELVQN